MGDKKKFLIIKPGEIGEIIQALPIANAIKAKYENAQIDWVLGNESTGIIKNNPLIDNYYIANFSKWKKGWLSPVVMSEIGSLNKKLQQEKYNFSIDAHGMFESSFIQAFCGAKNRIGYKDYKGFARFASNILIEPREKYPYLNYHITKRHLDLLIGSGIIKEKELKDIPIRAELPPTGIQAKEKIEKLLSPLNKAKKNVIITPAAAWLNRNWDKDYWRILYNALSASTNIIFAGTEGDLKLIEYIRSGNPNSLVLAGQTNLEEYMELLKHADIAISADSYAAQVAWALHVPHIFTIFCATSKHTYAPPGHTAFPLGAPICPPCNKKICFKPICTKQTSPKIVFHEIKKHLI